MSTKKLSKTRTQAADASVKALGTAWTTEDEAQYRARLRDALKESEEHRVAESTWTSPAEMLSDPRWWKFVDDDLVHGMENGLLYTNWKDYDHLGERLGKAELGIEEFAALGLAAMIREGATWQGLGRDGLTRLALLIAVLVLRDNRLLSQLPIYEKIQQFEEMFLAKEALEEYLGAPHGIEPRSSRRWPTSAERHDEEAAA